MFVVYWKGKVWSSIKNLLDKFDIPNILMDDADRNDNELAACNKIVASPWIPSHHDIYKNYSDKVCWELDIVWDILETNWYAPNFEFVWITWTDWKSTTTWITYNMFTSIYSWIFQSLGLHSMVWIGWNYDEPLSKIVSDIIEKNLLDIKHLVILEVSSFMAYRLGKFQFDWSIWTNFHPDHLNWHSDLEDYFQSKLNMLRNTKNKCIINKSLTQIQNYIPEEKISYYDVVEVESNFVWKHNKYNISASLCLIKEYLDYHNFNISVEYFINLLKDIKPLSHRIQLVKEVNWIKIYDDGKSTTAQSLKAAINAFEKKVILIAWGSDKGDDFTILKDDFSNYIGFAAFMWVTSNKLWEVAKNAGVDFCIVNSMHDAVKTAYDMAKFKWIDVILFSPGCASFDMFKNREDRVNKFLTEVETLD